MDSRKKFFEIINKYYCSVVGEKIPGQYLIEMSKRVADYYFDQYVRFYNQYPKSQKRYSTFDLKDIDHPSTFEIVIKFFKEIDLKNYLHYSSITLKISENEVLAFEQRRKDFYNMF